MTRGVVQNFAEALQKLGARCRAERVQQLEKIVDDTFLQQRDYFLFRLERCFTKPLTDRSGNCSTAATPEVRIAIGSLSQLRKVVPCRFSTLRQHWIAAGLPLRRERSVESTRQIVGGAVTSLSKDSYIAFGNWLATFGFRVEDNPGENEILFYLIK